MRTKILPIVGVLLLFSCKTLSYWYQSPGESLENRDYVIELRAESSREPIVEVTFFYSINSGPWTRQTVEGEGPFYSFTIPGELMTPGTLEYYATVVREGTDAEDTLRRKVRILSFDQAVKEASGRLSRRVRLLTDKKQIPFNRDLPLELLVSKAAWSTQVSVFYRMVPGDYETLEMAGDNEIFSTIINREELNPGTFQFYFKLEEEDPDLGQIEAFYPARGAGAPLSLEVLDSRGIARVVGEELKAGMIHHPPGEVLIRDGENLNLRLRITQPEGGMIRYYNHNTKRVFLLLAVPGRPGDVAQRKGTYSGSGEYVSFITPAEMRQGIRAYGFKVIETFPELGRDVTIFFPGEERSQFFRFEALTPEEMEARIVKKAAGSLGHSSPGESTGISDLVLRLDEKKEIPYPCQIFLNLENPATGEGKKVLMERLGSAWIYSVSPLDQQQNLTRYSFIVILKSTPVGRIEFNYPRDLGQSPFSYKVLPPKEVYAREVRDLGNRISHTPVSLAYTTSDLVIKVGVKDRGPRTSMIVSYRRPRGGEPKIAKGEWKEGRFVAVIPREDLLKGYSEYFFTVTEPHFYFGEVIYNSYQNQKERFIRFRIVEPESPQDLPADGGNNLISQIMYKPLLAVKQGNPFKFHLLFKEIKPDKSWKAFVFYKKQNVEDSYNKVEMKWEGSNFRYQLSTKDISVGNRVDYYFIIYPPGNKKGVVYRDGGVPFYFVVKQ